MPTWRGIIANLAQTYSDAKRAKSQQEAANNRAANWTAGATVAIAAFTFVTIGVGVAQWCVLTGTLSEMKSEQRPWLEVTKIEAEPGIEPLNTNSATIQFREIIENVGKTAPKGFYIGAKTDSGKNWQSVAEGFCEAGRKQAKSGLGRFLRFTIIPSGNVTIDGDTEGVTTSISLADLKAGKPPQPNIIGCIIYGSEFDAFLHQTQFIGQFAPLDSSGRIRIRAIITANAN